MYTGGRWTFSRMLVHTGYIFMCLVYKWVRLWVSFWAFNISRNEMDTLKFYSINFVHPKFIHIHFIYALEMCSMLGMLLHLRQTLRIYTRMNVLKKKNSHTTKDDLAYCICGWVGGCKCVCLCHRYSLSLSLSLHFFLPASVCLSM